MSFGAAISSVFSKYAVFAGRAPRSEFWFFVLFNLIVQVVLTVIEVALLRLPILSLTYTLAVFLPGLAVSVRRLHDIDRSGWFILLALIPVIGAVLLIVWYCTPGTAGPNRFDAESSRAGAVLEGFLHFIDSLSTWVGRAFAWLILVLTFAMSYEVFVRYALSAPTTWAFDFSYILYGALFLMSGAYTLAHNSHVRGDFMYRKWRPRVQATLDLVLYFLFFLPGISALVYSGWSYAKFSVQFREVSIFSPAGIPVFPLKALIPLAGALLLIQGIAEIIRCILCLRTGVWPQRLKDVEEMETVILHEQQFLREHGQAAQPGAKGIGA